LRHADAMAQYKYLWLRLSALTQDLGHCMGRTYGTFTLFSFGLLVGTCFGFLVSVTRAYTMSTHAFLCGIFFFFTILYSQGASAQMATDKVSSHHNYSPADFPFIRGGQH
jgi:glycerol-3-phosphate acyltransferase PlsY